MQRYHVNFATGNAGICSAIARKCPFGEDDNHFTSEEAARQAYENWQSSFSGLWSPEVTKLDIQALFSTAELTLQPAARYSAKEDGSKPVGSVVVRIHRTEWSVSYLVKAEDRRWHPVIKRAGAIVLAPLSHSSLSMEHIGDTSYYFTELDPDIRGQIDSLAISIAVASGRLSELSRTLAKAIHNGWCEDRDYAPSIETHEGKEIDVANTSFFLLPNHFKVENMASAKSALEAIVNSKQYGGVSALHVPAVIHEDWVKRNDPKSWGKADYYALSPEEQAKNIAVLVKALEILKGN